MRLSRYATSIADSPFDATHDLARGGRHDGRLLDVAQAAPPYPPASMVIDRVIETARHDAGSTYTEPAGLPHLREAFAADLSSAYQATVEPSQVVVTAGCNQAFCLAVAALADAGDEVVLTVPYYPNHDMWLRLSGITPVHLDPGPDLLPDPERADSLITERTRAIVVVSPGNPTGVSWSHERIDELARIAHRRGIALIVDETYRSFRETDDPPHMLFGNDDWPEFLISLHSFSKDFAIPGYRVGAIVAGSKVTRQTLKLLDCMAICAPRVGQEAAWAGLTTARRWRRERAAELTAQRKAFSDCMADQPGGFELRAFGACFGWVRHPFDGRATEEVMRDLAHEHGVLAIAGTAFMPKDTGDFRVSFGNLSSADLADLATRFAAMSGGRLKQDAGGTSRRRFERPDNALRASRCRADIPSVALAERKRGNQ